MTKATTRSTRLKLEVEEYWPRLTRFYGLSPAELYSMPRNVRAAYIKALPALEAREQLAAIEAGRFANLKAADQRSILRRLEKQAQMRKPEPVRPKSAEEAMQMYSGIGIQLEVVPK